MVVTFDYSPCPKSDVQFASEQNNSYILTVTLTPGEELFIRQQPVKMVIADEQVSRPPQVIVKIRRETLVNIAVNIKKQGLDSCGASVSYFVGLLQ